MLLLFRKFVCSVRNLSFSIALSVLATRTLTMCQSTSRRLSRQHVFTTHCVICSSHERLPYATPSPRSPQLSSDIAAFTHALHTLRYGRDMYSGEKTAKYAAVCCWRLSVTRSVCVCVCVLQTAARAILVSVLPRDQKGDSQLDWGWGPLKLSGWNPLCTAQPPGEVRSPWPRDTTVV